MYTLSISRIQSTHATICPINALNKSKWINTNLTVIDRRSHGIVPGRGKVLGNVLGIIYYHIHILVYGITGYPTSQAGIANTNNIQSYIRRIRSFKLYIMSVCRYSDGTIAIYNKLFYSRQQLLNSRYTLYRMIYLYDWR